MSLFYMDDDTKINYPNGFVHNKTNQLYFAEAEGWEKHTESL